MPFGIWMQKHAGTVVPCVSGPADSVPVLGVPVCGVPVCGVAVFGVAVFSGRACTRPCARPALSGLLCWAAAPLAGLTCRQWETVSWARHQSCALHPVWPRRPSTADPGPGAHSPGYKSIQPLKQAATVPQAAPGRQDVTGL